jgi:putative ABC transport system permease protein
LIGNLIAGGMANMGGEGGFGGAFGGFSGMPEITPVITLDLLLSALVFGVLVAVIFGLYPARRASKLKPVDALRYE